MVGVVGNGKYLDLDEPELPFMYFAFSQHYQAGFLIVARTKADPRRWVEPLAQVVRTLGLTSVAQPITLESWMNLSLFTQRLTATAAAALSALGLLLAVLGLAGAISHSVAERKKELGIPVALGARASHLLNMVLRQTLVVAGTGVIFGVLLGTAATAIFRSQFFGIGPFEWIVLVPVGAGMLAISLLVAYVSARPWIRIDPMEAVRHA
ncbi:MAG: FtsX-like permease family protein [Bryobacteraceae bacterium]